jgi:hypothetical protein
LSPPQPILSYPSDLRQRPITNIQEPDVDAMFEKEEDFMNLQNRYQDNLGPLFEPIRQSARLQSDAALSYPTHVKRKSKEEVPIQEPTLSYPSFIDLDPVELVSNKKLRLSYPSSIGLEPKEEASIQDSGLSDRTCIKHEHESHQDSDHRVLIKLDPLEGASDEDVCPTFLIPDPHKLDSIPTNVKPEESKHKIPNTMSKSCSDASQTSAESKEPAQSNSETYISHREYVPLSKSLRQPRSQSDENDVLSCVDNVKASSTGSSSLYTRKIQVGSSSKLETDTYEKGALSDCLQDQDNEEMDLNLPTRSQKRKGKQNQDSSNDKKRKGKAQDNAGTKSETEQVASPIDNPTPIVPYDPIDDYKMEPVGPDEHLLTFPFKKIQKEKGQEKRQEKKNSVIVYEADEKRLDDKTYLNDTLLEVFPKIWAEQFPSASIHTFSSFFFTKLCGEDLDAFKYKDVERWTKDNDIFKKKVLIVPINQSSHWYILLVTNPGYCIQTDKSDEYHESFNSDNGESSSRRKTRKRMINPGTKLNQQK